MEYIDGIYIERKYSCKECGGNCLTSNIKSTHVKGYKCVECGEINYPVKDALERIKKNQNDNESREEAVNSRKNAENKYFGEYSYSNSMLLNDYNT